jgi:hypothetical protein
LKPDAVSKHQRPYKLPPHKRDVLRHQLDELLSQGIIAPVNEKELLSFDISCPKKRNSFVQTYISVAIASIQLNKIVKKLL